VRNRLADVRWGVVATLKLSPKPRDFGLMAMSVAAHTSASRVWSVGHENALNRSSAQERSLAEAARSRPLTQTSVRRDLIGDVVPDRRVHARPSPWSTEDG